MVQESYALGLQFEDRLRIVEGQQTTETAWRIVAEYRPDLVVFDHLRLFRDKHDSEVKRMGIITQRVKDIAQNFNCASLLLAQLNRKSEERSDKIPTLADLRDSGEIEENGDLIMMIHREEAQTAIKPEKSPTQLWIRKFRDGPRDSCIKLLFNLSQEWFEEYPK